MLTDAGAVDGIRSGELADGLDHVLRAQLTVGGTVVAQRVRTTDVVQVRPPLREIERGAVAMSARIASMSSVMTSLQSPTIGTSA